MTQRASRAPKRTWWLCEQCESIVLKKRGTCAWCGDAVPFEVVMRERTQERIVRAVMKWYESKTESDWVDTELRLAAAAHAKFKRVGHERR